jgi:ABC-type siderophore export system fused ATPase/permease subunit
MHACLYVNFSSHLLMKLITSSFFMFMSDGLHSYHKDLKYVLAKILFSLCDLVSMVSYIYIYIINSSWSSIDL